MTVQLGLFDVIPLDIEALRRSARHFCYSNQGFKKYGIPNSVTMDDIRADKGIEPISRRDWPHSYSHNNHGDVFKKGFARVGFYKSKAAGRNGSIIGIWTMDKQTKDEMLREASRRRRGEHEFQPDKN